MKSSLTPKQQAALAQAKQEQEQQRIAMIRANQHTREMYRYDATKRTSPITAADPR